MCQPTNCPCPRSNPHSANLCRLSIAYSIFRWRFPTPTCLWWNKNDGTFVMCSGDTNYRAPKCQRLCADEKEFELPLPPEPEDDGTTRANKWGIVMLNQVIVRSLQQLRCTLPPVMFRWYFLVFLKTLTFCVKLGQHQTG